MSDLPRSHESGDVVRHIKFRRMETKNVAVQSVLYNGIVIRAAHRFQPETVHQELVSDEPSHQSAVVENNAVDLPTQVTPPSTHELDENDALARVYEIHDEEAA